MNLEERFANAPNNIKIEFSDAIQFFLRTNADQQMRAVIRLERRLDFQALRRAAKIAIINEIMLCYYYVETDKGAIWQKTDSIDFDEIAVLIECANDYQEVLESALIEEIDPFSFPLVKLSVIRRYNDDTLVININHTIADAQGFKSFIRALIDAYNDVVFEKDISLPGAFRERSIENIVNQIDDKTKGEILMNAKTPSENKDYASINWADVSDDNKNRFAFTNIEPELFEKIKMFCKANNATINDYLVTAFARTINSIDENSEKEKAIIMPVDLRKYDNSNVNRELCSVVSSVILKLGVDLGDSFLESLSKVKHALDGYKANRSDLAMIVSSDAMFQHLPYKAVKQIMESQVASPMPLITNLGIIDDETIKFKDNQILDAFLTGVVSKNKHFCMAFSTFKNQITFSIGYNGGDMQKEKIDSFLKNYIEEVIRSII
jgi:NRPS condensation-like uncharacterized protein